jgi:hypothetical protein
VAGLKRSRLGREARIALDRAYARLGRAGVAGALREVECFALFVGYPRSGHTLLGTLLNAHPEAVIAHELNVLRYVARGFSREELAYLLLRRDRWFSLTNGSRWAGYDYHVAGQHQGSWTRLRVLGDKKGDGALVHLGGDPGLLTRLEETMGVPVKCIHHVRNPFDNLATFARKKGWPLERAFRVYRRQVATAADLKRRLPPDRFFELHHEDFVTDPRAELVRLCGFLRLAVDDDFLDAASALVFDSPRRTRDSVDWPADLSREVERLIGEVAFLRRYGSSGAPSGV